MYRIRFINLPFAALQFPSLALTQLKSVVESRCGEQVQAQLIYANHEFAPLPGETLYQEIATSVRHGLTGLGDWLFRRVAFPELPDNSTEYLARCYPRRDPEHERLRQAICRLRDQVETWLDGLIDRHALDRMDLIGLTSMFSQNVACFALARKIKLRNPAATIVLGGANCEHPMGAEIVRQVRWLDFVFSGPALCSFPEFVEQRLRGDDAACQRIDGVFSRRNAPPSPQVAGNRELPLLAMSTPTFGRELEIDVPVPLDYDDFLASLQSATRLAPALLFETSRGCWWGERAHCTFCGLNGLLMKYRAMPPARALEQFRRLFAQAARFPKLELHAVDNILPREYLDEVFPQLDTPTNVEIFYEVKSDLRPDDVATLARARVLMIQPGIEALATSTLQLMRKGTTAFHGVLLLKRCSQHGIVPHWNLLIGFPGESAEVYQKYLRDIPRLTHLPPPMGVFPVRFDRYSPYFANPQAYGLDLRPYEFYRLVYPFPEATLAKIAYFFFDNNFRADYFVQMVDWIGPLGEHIDVWVKRYAGADGRPRAELSLVDEGAQAYLNDTRDGTARRHALNRTGLRLLELLNEPRDRRWLAQHLADEPFPDWEQELSRLLDWNVLFEEQGRWLSLVQSRTVDHVPFPVDCEPSTLQNS